MKYCKVPKSLDPFGQRCKLYRFTMDSVGNDTAVLGTGNLALYNLNFFITFFISGPYLRANFSRESVS
jgi:hypothetical protein